MTGRAHAYLIDGAWVITPEPECSPPSGESWPSHPWAITDPSLLTYQDCPRCRMRRLVISRALAAAASRPALPL